MKKHLLEAAERGDAEAQLNLGVIYENGLNDSRYAAEGNRPEAVRSPKVLQRLPVERAAQRVLDVPGAGPGQAPGASQSKFRLST